MDQVMSDCRDSSFINQVFNFLGIGIGLYIMARVYGWASNDSVIKNTVKCKYCRKRISEKVGARFEKLTHKQ